MNPKLLKRSGWRRNRLVLALLGVGLVVVCAFIKSVIHRYIHLAQYAKRAEGSILLEEIQQAQRNHFAKHGEYVAVGATPSRLPGKRQAPFESDHMEEWKRLGWQPESTVRCQYEVTVPTATDFRAVARCDVDGDGEVAIFACSAEQPPKRMTPDNVL